MKKPLLGFALVTAVLAAPPASKAATFFTDTFSNGSTTNGLSVPGGTPTASRTSYDQATTKSSLTSTIAPGLFRLKLASGSSSAWWESQALFTTNAVALATPGDYIDLAIVFTNAINTNAGGNPSGNTLLSGSTASAIWVGLFNSAGSPPVPNGALAGPGAPTILSTTTGSTNATGNCANWQGYVAQIFSNAAPRLITRPLQAGAGTTSANQDLLGNNAGSGAFNNPAGTVLASAPGVNINLIPLNQYTLQFRLTLDPAGSGELIISNALYNGVGTGGSVVVAQSTNTPSTPLSIAYDGLAFGAFTKATAGTLNTTNNPQMDVTSITITGQSTVITNAPSIDTNPVPVIVANGGACEFTVSASGVGMTYQWHRNGTNLLDGGNISGVTTPALIINTAGPADVFSSANGYYVTVTGTGNYSTNSTTNSLTLDTAANLVWGGTGGDWDLATTSNFYTGGNPLNVAIFNYGDNVTFDDTGNGDLNVNLAGNYLSAGTVTVNATTTGDNYVFAGAGSITGPGSFNYIGSSLLTLNCVNSYTGGTIISNSAADLVLDLYGGLGNGPVTLAKAGGQMEITITGAATTGINGPIIVADDFSIQFDKGGSFAGVFLGDLNGTAGKTLTFNPKDLTTTNRFRVYGTNSVYDANLAINGPATLPNSANYSGSALAPYNPGGTQTYNGVISDGTAGGNTGLVQRGNGTTILNGQNTYSGGTTPTTGTIAVGANSTGSGPITSGPIGTGPLFVAPELPNTTGSGTIEAWLAPRTIANPIDYPSATNNQTLIIGGTNALTFSGGVTLNGDDATGTNTIRTFQVTNTALTTFSGVVSDGGAVFGLTKTGSGVLALNNAETYTGPTAVSAGTLQVNGSLATASAVTVATNGTLSGSGTVNGATTVSQGGTLAPGAASIGAPLTFSSSLSLGGNMSVRVNRAGSVSDNAVVSGALTGSGAGTITVTNLGATLQPGDTFTLFNKAVTGAGGLLVTGGGGATTWTNMLANNGTIQVVSVIPPTIGLTNFGATVTLSWPANYIGWLLQSNSVGITNSTNWFTVANSASTNSVRVTPDRTKTNVFYRLTP